MPLKRLDHVNILTANLEAMTAWYEHVLGLENGARPPFSIPGAWLYLDGFPIVHLVDVAETADTRAPRLEHFAISGTGLKEFLSRLDAEEIAYTVDPVPEFPIVQINFHDPEGNHIHADFPKDEAEGLI